MSEIRDLYGDDPLSGAAGTDQHGYESGVQMLLDGLQVDSLSDLKRLVDLARSVDAGTRGYSVARPGAAARWILLHDVDAADARASGWETREAILL